MASELPCVEQGMTVALPDDSSECSTQSGCVYEKRSINAETLMRYCSILAVLYLVCSVITFCSSAYTGEYSMLDSVLVMVDLMTIDISSAFFVSAGLTATVLYLGASAARHQFLVRSTVLSMLTDMCIATVAVLILGSLHALLMHSFKWGDVAFTLLEGVTTL